MYSTSRFPSANSARSGAVTRVASALAAVCALTFASGCSLLSDNLDRAAKGVGRVVVYYCENITVPEIREEVRAAVNKHSAPHSVAVTCADGGPALNSADAPAPTPEATAPAEQPVAWNFGAWLDRLPIFFVEKQPSIVIHS